MPSLPFSASTSPRSTRHGESHVTLISTANGTPSSKVGRCFHCRTAANAACTSSAGAAVGLAGSVLAERQATVLHRSDSRCQNSRRSGPPRGWCSPSPVLSSRSPVPWFLLFAVHGPVSAEAVHPNMTLVTRALGSSTLNATLILSATYYKLPGMRSSLLFCCS